MSSYTNRAQVKEDGFPLSRMRSFTSLYTSTSLPPIYHPDLTPQVHFLTSSHLTKLPTPPLPLPRIVENPLDYSQFQFLSPLCHSLSPFIPLQK